ncbi:transposase [Rhodococcus sp. JVH1]|uniref:transposase n=1 Tax=Rhodococcus sp. JVH1 TaxID=745408 RepID=UPI003524BDDF
MQWKRIRRAEFSRFRNPQPARLTAFTSRLYPNARTEAANTGIKNIKRIRRGFRDVKRCRPRILLTSAARC